jgi:hypothetical protein
MPVAKIGSIKTDPIRNLKNTSQYPDEWVRQVILWLCERLKTDRCSATVRNTQENYNGSGRAFLYSNRIVLTVNRRRYRKNWQYANHSWDNHGRERIVSNPLESFVFIAAHEIAHISPEGVRIYEECRKERNLPLKRDWRKRMEAKIQDIAQSLLEEYRKDASRSILRRYAEHLRSENAKVQRKVEKKAKASTVDARLERIEARTKAWVSKLRRAQTALEKLARRKRAILAAQKRMTARASGQTPQICGE